MFNLIYRIIDSKVKEMTKYNYDFDTLDATMKAQIDKYLKTYKVEDAKNLNLVKPTEKEMIMYLIYLLECQKKNDSEALENMQKIIDFKIDVHNGELVKEEIDALFSMYRTQLKLFKGGNIDDKRTS